MGSFPCSPTGVYLKGVERKQNNHIWMPQKYPLYCIFTQQDPFKAKLEISWQLHNSSKTFQVGDLGLIKYKTIIVTT